MAIKPMEEVMKTEDEKGLDDYVEILKSFEPLDVPEKRAPEVDPDTRCYSPSEAISSGTPSPATSPCPTAILSKEPLQGNKSAGAAANKGVKFDNDSDDDDDCLIIMDEHESPASPAPEDCVYIATVPKIIATENLREETDALITTSLFNSYRPPDVSLLPKVPSALAKNFQLSSAGVKTLSELGLSVGGLVAKQTPQEASTSGVHNSAVPPTAEEKAKKVNDVFNKVMEHRKTLLKPPRDTESPTMQIQEKTQGFCAPTSAAAPPADVDMRFQQPAPWGATNAPTSAQVSFVATQVPPPAPVQVTSGYHVLSNGDTDHRMAAAGVPGPLVLPPPSVVIPSLPRYGGPGGPGAIQQPHVLPTRTPILPSPVGIVPMRPPGQRPPLVGPPGPWARGPMTRPNGGPPRAFSTGVPSAPYGFFNTPAGPRPMLRPPFMGPGMTPYAANPSNIPVNGIVVPDDSIITCGMLEPNLLRSMLERFIYWKQCSQFAWKVKIHMHIVRMISLKKAPFDAGEAAVRGFHFSELFKEFAKKGGIEILEAHDCDESGADRSSIDYLRCLAGMVSTNPSSTVIFLSNVYPGSETGRQLLASGVQLWSLDMIRRNLTI